MCSLLRPPCQRVTPRCAGRCRGATEGAGPEGLSAAADWGIPPRGHLPPIFAHFSSICPTYTNTKPRRGYLRGFVHRGVGKYIKVSECLD